MYNYGPYLVPELMPNLWVGVFCFFFCTPYLMINAIQIPLIISQTYRCTINIIEDKWVTFVVKTGRIPLHLIWAQLVLGSFV